MQGQTFPVQVKDPDTASMNFYPHACRLILQTYRSVQCTPPKNNEKLIDGSTPSKKTTTKMVQSASDSESSGIQGIRLKKKKNTYAISAKKKVVLRT